MWVGALHENLGQMGKKWFLRHNLATTCQNFTNNPLSFKFTLSNCFSIFKTHKQKSITNNSWRLNRIPQKSASDPKKKTWQKLSGFKLTSWLSNKTFLNLFFFCFAEFYENSALFWYPFKNQKQFSFQKFFENRKIQLYHIRPNSINFKMVLLESSLHCASEGKTRIQFCVHAQLELPLENVQSKKYCVSKAMCVGRRNWCHILFNFEGNFCFHKNKLQ